MMNWNELISSKRLGSKPAAKQAENYNRTQFQRDYDRIIFSSPFRRMQNKTQVFPLPGSIFVHNRLTHSLEVASVGRSLGNILSEKLLAAGETNPLISELGAVVSAACLAHDMGNPPFGHAGEEAISSYFRNGKGQNLELMLKPEEWKDFVYFDGNANALRLLSHQFHGRRAGGFALTYTTLASIVKYPFESVNVTKPKFGFFQSEKACYEEIARELNIKQLENNPLKFARHPLVFLVEAADDICYQLMDLEDAHKLGILTYEQTKALFLNFYDQQADKDLLAKIEATFNEVLDHNERIAYLRAGVINKLVHQCMAEFEINQEAIMEGTFQQSLISQVKGISKVAMDEIQALSIEKIYRHRAVVEVEISGHQIIGTLLEAFTEAVLSPDKGYSRRLISLMPVQYKVDHHSTYEKVQSVIDFVSGMTDLYALDLFRKIKGINLPSLG
ncbi:deoxyguanosinetriphosphate triphosphohydrolase [uncultured Sunxiuqinia sp.]|uniref:deoxyguanosinetriphosphate triphosphohydrolase n=1 Tax=uncultured Sunxiuqinia sp. TaxID=1573825 RepID=UPI00261684EC|nr:deoxyguanosinetriphosphate triphosphohydrolase [uncultured Sunxiuqinia sp.]